MLKADIKIALANPELPKPNNKFKKAPRSPKRLRASEVSAIVGFFEHGVDQIAIQVEHEDVIVVTLDELRA